MRGNTRIRCVFFVLLLGTALAAAPAFALAPGGAGAIVTVPISGTDDTAYAAAVDPAGNLVMAGATSTGLSALAGIVASGDVDPLFGIDGIITYNLSTGTESLFALVRMADGRYVGCGVFFSPGTGNDFFVARYLADGSLDASFNGAGYAVTSFLPAGGGALLFDQCNAVAVASDNSVVAAGETDETGPSHVGVMRFTSDGTLDAGFASGGRLDIDGAASPTANSAAHALWIQPDGKVVIAGYAGGTSNNDVLVVRLNANGTLDQTFADHGIARTPIGAGEDIANAVMVQPDGRIVVAGSAVMSVGRRDFVIARYTSTGALDPTFGTGGFTTTPIGPSDDIAYALTRMPWGRYVAAGSARIDPSATGTDVALVSYNDDGSVDRYFGQDGIVMLDVLNHTDTIYGLAQDIDGEHFWATGNAAVTTNQDFLAVEFGLDDTIFRHGFDTNTAP